MAVFAMIASLLYGCSSNDDEGKSKESEQNIANEQKEEKDKGEKTKQEEIEVEPLPTTYEELAQLPPGEYKDMLVAGDAQKENIFNTFKDLPDLSENPTEKELDHYYREILKRVQQDFEGPENLINRLKFEAFGNPEFSDSRYQFKENLNVVFIIDASISMAQTINGKSKMDAAKDSILAFVKKLPEDAKVGIRVYGHKGDGSKSGKQLSCSSSELVYPISNFNAEQFQASLDKFSPNGWTPIGLALREAKKDLAEFDGSNHTNIVYLVSDGLDTCDDEPIEAAKDLYSSNISPIINVIGFDVDNEGQKQLKEIARATEGIYDTVTNESELQKELDKLNDLANSWEEWLKQGKQHYKLKYIHNDLDIFVYITREYGKALSERDKIYLILGTLYHDSNAFSKETYEYLKNKNIEYHDWIKSEINKFEEELKALNDKSYNEALEQLEEKYISNTQ